MKLSKGLVTIVPEQSRIFVTQLEQGHTFEAVNAGNLFEENQYNRGRSIFINANII